MSAARTGVSAVATSNELASAPTMEAILMAVPPFAPESPARTCVRESLARVAKTATFAAP